MEDIKLDYCPFMLDCVFYKFGGKGAYRCNQERDKSDCPEYLRRSKETLKKYGL